MPVEQMGSDFAALDFSFLYVRDLSENDSQGIEIKSEDDLPKLNIWSLQDSSKTELIEAVVKPSYFDNMAIAIVLDLDQPWDVMNQLRKWMSAIKDSLLQRMMPKMADGMLKKMQNKIVAQWKTYEEPQLDEQGYLIKKLKKEGKDNTVNKENSDEEDQAAEEDVRMEIPLPEGCLKVNLGIPIIVICSKVDLLQHGEKKVLLEQNLDFIQKHIREYCLQFGATVIFTSATANRNLDVLYQYILHRLYNFDFIFKPEIVERDAVFLPAGFDSPNLIE